ncbi:sulfotransferase family 2 domain-containing protein [Synechococcus sp. PCC 7336]|uniref:sulfotransferase family 2 domain-containing protein n=1 Tax=Synechococcus sp. PCC 7336 TaxID=195250 RepID=UPI0003456C7F|nr:sulfotransferase family 2 domain-containing protein [Synechococcus sp. PCC 7336]
MIISHQHRYVFIALPHTASTSISQELKEHYDGENILFKHSTYRDFLKLASADQRQYFAFSSIRNPIDEVTTRYFKYKTNHGGQFTNPSQFKPNGGWMTRTHRSQFAFVQAGADFSTFFQRYYRLPYDNWSSLNHRQLDSVIRYESLQEDFSAVLDRLGLQQVRPIPVGNKTREKQSNPFIYFSPEARSRAKWVFGPFMQRWGYEFPADWQDIPVPPASEVAYRVASIPRQLYWRYWKRQRGQGPRWLAKPAQPAAVKEEVRG